MSAPAATAPKVMAFKVHRLETMLFVIYSSLLWTPRETTCYSRPSLLGRFTRRARILRRRRINQDLYLAVIAGAVRFAKPDGLDARVVQTEILRDEVAHRARASFGQHAVFSGLALHANRRHHHGEAEFVGLQILARPVQRLLVFQLGGGGFVKNSVPVEVESLFRSSGGQARNFVFGQIGGVFVSAV